MSFTITNRFFLLSSISNSKMRRHSKFFSSLKQVEKRLKSEDQPPPKPQPPSVPPLDIIDTSGTESISSPIFLHSNRLNHSSILEESSEAAPAFLSSSPPFPSTAHEDPSTQIRNPEKRGAFEEDPVEDMIQRLIELLGLSEEGKGRERGDEGLVSGCDCEGGFYSKIVGVEGPKCDKEAERLEGWIKHLTNSGSEKMEPLRLAHLLLGKATQGQGAADCEFPSTVAEFLQNDYPTN